MGSSYFYYNVQNENQDNHAFIKDVGRFSAENKIQSYIIDRPLGESKYVYDYDQALVLLVPKYKILFVNFEESRGEEFEDFVLDFVEDLGSISDKYRYKEHIGRPREWSKRLIETATISEDFPIESLLESIYLQSPEDQKKCELLISLLTGSINDIERVGSDVPDTLLDRVKQKIQLFDGDQTHFVYFEPDNKVVRIQGLSGTGKTELLLHKLKELYVGSEDAKIIFTCHNRILAHNIKKRIPEFFNFMKVEKQIKWDERLWCVHAWGSMMDPNSGAYRYICQHYDIPFYRFSRAMSFERACSLAIDNIKALPDADDYAFDYMLIDESQDFPDAFFRLCELVTKKAVYIAGDIFQSIFDNKIVSEVSPDFLLSKCYRTDPRTLMFAHALGMGLFEQQKLRWLDDEEWRACGYLLEKKGEGTLYRLKREPLRRFEDIQGDKTSVELLSAKDIPVEKHAKAIVYAIESIKQENPTVQPEDVAVIFVDNDNDSYALGDRIEIEVPQYLGWQVNKAYETREKVEGELFVSNKNHVKGLEFPFVICIAGQVKNTVSYRNALYMLLTRSFIQTYLVFSGDVDDEFLNRIETGLDVINCEGYMEVEAPSDDDKEWIRTTIDYSHSSESVYDAVYSVMEEVGVIPLVQRDIYEMVRPVVMEKSLGKDQIRELVEVHNKIFSGG